MGSYTFGSFVRGGNYPLEAEYIFNSVEELLQWCAENQGILHDGLLKIVKDEENQILYWCYNKEFYPLCDTNSFDNLEKLKTFIEQCKSIEHLIHDVERKTKDKIKSVLEELDRTQYGVGLNGDGSFDKFNMQDTNYLEGATSIISCLKALDKALSEAFNEVTMDAFVKEAEYDSENEELVFTFVTKKGDQIVKIGVHSLIEEWETKSTNSIELKRDRSIKGVDVLSADVKVATNKENILEKTSEGLLVRGTSDNITHNGLNLNVVLDELQGDDSKKKTALIFNSYEEAYYAKLSLGLTFYLTQDSFSLDTGNTEKLYRKGYYVVTEDDFVLLSLDEELEKLFNDEIESLTEQISQTYATKEETYTKEETDKHINDLIEKSLYENPTNDYDYVDMGEAGVWATCNIGANNPEEYGLYFQWGDILGFSNTDEKQFSNDDYKFGLEELIKYNNNDNLTILELEDDAAHINMSGDWKIPTKEDYQKLIDNCNSEWVQNYNDKEVSGILFTLKTDESKQLFFPAAGNCDSGSIYGIGSNGYYWTSSLNTSWVKDGIYFGINNNNVTTGGYLRSYGLPIRGFMPFLFKDEKYLSKKEGNTQFKEVDNRLTSIESQLNSPLQPGNRQILYTTFDNKAITIPDSVLNSHSGQTVTGITKYVVSNEYYPSKGYGLITLNVDYAPECILCHQPTLKSIAISGSLTEFKHFAFAYNVNLREITLEDGLVTIDQAVFMENHSLRDIVIPDSVESIGAEQFYNCKSLMSCKLSTNSKFTTIPTNMFWKCYSLASIDIPEGITTLGSLCFAETGLIAVRLPDSCTTTVGEVFQWCKNLRYIDFNQVKGTIGINTCPNLKELIIPSGVTKITQLCEPVTVNRFVIPATVKSIDVVWKFRARVIDSSTNFLLNFPEPNDLETLILRHTGKVLSNLDTYVTTFLVEDSEVNKAYGEALQRGIETGIMPIANSNNLETYIGTPNNMLKIFVPAALLKGYQDTYPKLKRHFHPLTGEDTYVYKEDIESVTKQEITEMYNSIYNSDGE